MSVFKRSIQLKVLTGFFILTAIIVSLIAAILTMSEQSQKLANGKVVVHGLNDTIKTIQRSSSTYLSNAARDYESYFRDVEVYYRVLLKDIDVVTAKVERLSELKALVEELAGSRMTLIDKAEFDNLSSTIAETETQWASFKQSIFEEFGDNADEPRLEWGARYINNQSPDMVAQFENMVIQFDSIANRQTKVSAMVGQFTVAIVITFTLLFASWFYYQVIRPLVVTQKAFMRVADGDFGHQVPTQRIDELGQLTESFNQMSARSELVLNILTRLQNATSVADAVDSLYQSAHSYLACDVIIYAEKNAKETAFNFVQLSPKQSFKNLYKITIPTGVGNQRDLFLNQINSGELVYANHIASYVNEHVDATLLKALIDRYPLKSAMVQPLNKGDWQSLLIFASYSENQFNQRHIELLTQLQPVMEERLSVISLASKPQVEAA
ncbi:HAMP domain-containing protein [Pleionea sp. CnH1-48]|uniref:HAMP domain-containing protein n=1 Tax=Pleionea sp. CnH1-48 TaxID=2954494 RepID=UPI002097454B|nr:HAMP domain-containing protein [Pleionea sp. CnH1-48]MCO7225729.1 HAMP domain-containing protein [Pleionea sp. CnH1-48]